MQLNAFANMIRSYHTQAKQSPINTQLKHLVQTAHFHQALQRFAHLWNTAHFKPDHFTFPYILKASTCLANPTIGLLIHNTAIKTGFASNLFVANSLILFYGHFGNLNSIHYLFDQMPQRNVVTWTAAISALSQNHHFHPAISLFRDMQLAGHKPNSFTMATVLPCFSYTKEPVQIHSLLFKSGFDADVFVLTALIHVYAKTGSFSLAIKLFNEMPEKNVVSWNAMMDGCNENGNPRLSLQLFAKMRSSSGIQPDSFSLVAALHSCSNLTALRNGEEMHGFSYKVGLEKSGFVGNGLVDMYGKCGALELAEQVFYQMQERDVSSWTTLITCYGFHGEGGKAISIFEGMKQTRDIVPNSVTMTALLTACSHSCLVEDGIRYYELMNSKYGVKPTIKHYACVVDLLGRAGLLEEAVDFIGEMPIQADIRIWESLLGAATMHRDRTTAETAAQNLLKLQPENLEVHVQLANIHANLGWWEEVAKIRRMQSSKKPGLSYLTTC